MQASEMKSHSFPLEFVSPHLLVAATLVQVKQTNVDARVRASQHLLESPPSLSLPRCLFHLLSLRSLPDSYGSSVFLLKHAQFHPTVYESGVCIRLLSQIIIVVKN